MKTMVSEHMVDTSDELQQQIFDAERQVNNNADICKVMCILLRMARSKNHGEHISINVLASSFPELFMLLSVGIFDNVWRKTNVACTYKLFAQ